MTRNSRATLALGASLPLLAILLVASDASAKPYPTNKCVSVKQREAGKYCRLVLKAWSQWDSTGDAARRDAAITNALVRLERAWLDAESDAAARDAECAQTTLSTAEVATTVAAAAEQIVAAVNGGLNLGDRKEATCGRKLLEASGELCRRLLRAEGDYIDEPGRDAKGVKRDGVQAKADANFERLFGRWQNGPACPSTATADGVGAQVRDLAGALVTATTVSPHVDDAQYTTISPTGAVPYLGRDYSAVCMNGSPYHFFVKRGSVNKVLMYYQGGGACWEQLTCSVPVCDTSVNPNGGDNPNNTNSGFASRDNPLNPFRDWNIVFISYCSCDIHFGDAAQDYPLHVEHRGYQNARVVEKWAREHFLDPEEVFVTGSSAGAYGAWFHAPLLHEVWPNAHFDVLADAGNGVITQSFLDDHFPNWNFAANIPDTIPGLRDILLNGEGIPGYTEVVADYFPETNWAHYSTAFDGGTGGQTGFYAVMLADNPIAAINWHTASCAFNQKMREQAIATAAAVPDNYRYYIGTGSRHTMWGSNKVYSDVSGGVPTIVDWVNAMLDSEPGAPDPAWSNVECTDCGVLLPGDPRPNPLAPPFVQVAPGVVEIQCETAQ